MDIVRPDPGRTRFATKSSRQIGGVECLAYEPDHQPGPDLHHARRALSHRTAIWSGLMQKWLMVLDQVGHSRFAGALPPGLGPAPVALSLDYVPRTTPVGHATISTGAWPSTHLVQGRSWYGVVGGAVTLHETANLPNLYPVLGTVFDHVYRASLAAQLRGDPAHQNAAIIALATKDFIPFLFGAWDTDVSVYPRTTKPVTTGGTFAIDIIFDTFTPRGAGAVHAAQAVICALALNLVPTWTVSWLPAVHAVLGPNHVRHAMRWQVPPTWGATDATRGRDWFRLISAQIIDIDQFYTDIALEILKHVAGVAHEIVIQSVVATDSYGHFYGPSSPQYVAALNAGIQRAQNLHNNRWSVLVTSDHGGRDTPTCWYVSAGSLQHGVLAIPLGTATIVLEGDHLVGYAAGPPPGRIKPLCANVT
jgi:hypothetical protein